MSRLWLYVGVGLLALAAGLMWSQRQKPVLATEAVAQTPQDGAPPRSGTPLLSAALPDLSGAMQRIDQWKGKVLVVNFWATWCAPCREEIPILIEVQKQLGPQGVQIVGIAIDQAEKVRPYAADIGVNYPVLIGELEAIDLSRQAGNRIGALPFTVILDRTGKVAKAELGGLSRAKLETVLRPLL